MPENDLLYRLALSSAPGIGPVYAKKLLSHFGNAGAIFKANAADLRTVEGIGEARVNAITGFDRFPTLEKEMAFIEKYSIRCLFFTDKDYPQRLTHCKDAPILLFYRGNADLNARRILSIVGTRSPSEYGKQAVERLTKELSGCGPLIVSGLAFGIDATAHKTALSNSLSTIAVLGHGLDRIYPKENKPLAVKILKQGGLLTNFNTYAENSPKNFPLRNRIVAGICDAVIVVETDTDGGSMLTVANAQSYQKKVFAFPGRITDKTSRGCNRLIQTGAAQLLMHASQLITEMGWDSPKASSGIQARMFASASEDLTENEKMVLRLLSGNEPRSLDELAAETRLSSAMIALSLINLELQGWILPLPGKRYRLAA